MRRKKLYAVVFCLLVLARPCFANTNIRYANINKADPLQAADIIGARADVDKLLALQKKQAEPGSQSEESLMIRGAVLRKILQAMLAVRQACNKIDLELAYTYDVMRKEERHEDFVFELFNLANFAQLSTFYTMEPWVRIHKDFKTSAIFTTTSGSLGTAITTFSKLYAHTARASHVAPPKFFAGIIDGAPVDTGSLPPCLSRYLDAKAPDSNQSRREALFAQWKNRFHIDASNQEALCGLADRNKASIRLLSSRVLLLWSLHTTVQDFDRDLLALFKTIKNEPMENSGFANTDINVDGCSTGANEVIALLKIGPQVKQLISLQKNGDDSTSRDELELLVLEKTLEGALEVQVASDKVDDELYYNYHIALASLLESRQKWLQYIYNLNFLQAGIMGIIAGKLYLSDYADAGDRQFVIAGGIGTTLTGLAIMTTHGFWRKVDTQPNSLAEILNLHPATEYRFSPFVSSFLNTAPPGSLEHKTRRQLLNDAWKKAGITTINLDRNKNREALGDMPSHKYDTINIVSNRNVLLHSLKEELESFQLEVLELLHATQ